VYLARTRDEAIRFPFYGGYNCLRDFHVMFLCDLKILHYVKLQVKGKSRVIAFSN